MEEGLSLPDTSVNEDPQTSTRERTNASSSKSSSGGGGNAGTSGQSRGRATLVCQECKRQKSGCDRKKPCGTCVKKNTVDRCVYSAAAGGKVDVHSLNTRTTEIEAILGAFCRGFPIDFTPIYTPAVQAMEEKIAAYPAQGGAMNSTFRHDHHDAVTRADNQLFFLCGPVAIARSYGSALSEHAGIEGVCACDGQGLAGEDCLRVKGEATSDVDEVMHSTGSSAMSGISTPTPASSKAKGKRKMSSQVHASSDPLASSARRQNAQAFLPPVGVYYSELTPSASTAAVHGILVSNPEPRTGSAALEAAPFFYANTQHLPQDPVNPSTTDLLPVPAAPSPLASSSSTVSSPHGYTSKPFVTLALLGRLPRPDSGVQYLKSAKNALNCFVVDLGLPGGRRLGWMTSLKCYQQRLVRRGLSGASSMTPATGEAADLPPTPRLEGKSNPGGSRKKAVSTYDGDTAPSNVAAGSRRLAQVRATMDASPRSSARLPAPLPAQSEYGKSRMRDDVSISSSDSSPPQNESLPYFALTAALMAVGASNSPPVRAHKTEPSTKFGTVIHSESPSFLFALSQQALGVWMDGGQPVPVGVKDELAAVKDTRADFLRACLVGVHFLMGTANVDSPNRLCARSRTHDSPGRQAILSLLGKMVAALRSWGFAEGLLSPSSLSKVDGRSKPMSAPATSSKNASSQQIKRRNGKSVKIQGTELNSSSSGRDQESEDSCSEGEESRIRVLWDVYYYDLIFSDGFGEEPLIPASCLASTPLPSLPPDIDSDMQRIDSDTNEDKGTSPKDQQKVKEKIERMRLEQIYLIHRASSTSLISGIKRDMASSCCGHTLDQAVRMENSVKEWTDGLPHELRWAFTYGVENTASRLVAIGKGVLDDESQASSRGVGSGPKSAVFQSRSRVLSCELALITQLLVLNIFSPFVSEHLAKGGPAPESHSSVATALRHLRAPAQAIIHVSRLMHDVWELAAQSERSTFHTPPSLKPSLLGLYPLDQLLLDATLVCSRICCGVVPSEPGGEGLGMDRCDPCSSEMMLSIGMGLTLLEHLHGASQRSHSSNRNSSLSTPCHPSVGIQLVKLVRKRWEVKNVSLAPPETSKRDRSTLEAEDREGEDCYVGSNESDASICQMEFCSDIVEEAETIQPQHHSGQTRVDWTRESRYHSITAACDFGPAIPRVLPRVTLPPTLASSLSAKTKRSKEKVPKKQKHHPVIRVRPNGITGQQTSFARNFMGDGTPGPAEEPLNLATAEPPGHCPATGMHIPSMPLMLPDNFKSEYDNGAATTSMSLAHYSTLYTSSNAMMGTAHPHYRGEAPHTDTASRHPQHLYAPAPPFTPIYTTPSHPQSPSPANPNYFRQQFEPQPYLSGYYEEQSMAGHLGSSTEWSQTSEATQTHEQGYM